MRLIPLPNFLGDTPEHDSEDERRAAFAYISEAWEEARFDGIDSDCLAQVALFSALNELVATYGEEATCRYTEGLAERIRAGEFTVSPVKQ
ncbi:MAG TPA: hypothetical protein VNR41_01305 [Xanthobacteraceae bacterium]|nr:hypothetical protein [Xanthobacteraceae bacterium]